MSATENGGGYERGGRSRRIVDGIKDRITSKNREREWFADARADMVADLGDEADPAGVMTPTTSRRKLITLGAGAGVGYAVRGLATPVAEDDSRYDALSKFLYQNTRLHKYYDPVRGFDGLTSAAEGGSVIVFDKSDKRVGRKRMEYGLLLPREGNLYCQSHTPAIEVRVTQYEEDPSIRARVVAHFVPESDTFVLSNREEAIFHSAESPDFMGPGVKHSPFTNNNRLEALSDVVQDVIRETSVFSSRWNFGIDVSDVRGVETRVCFSEDGSLVVEATGEMDYEMPLSDDPRLHTLLAPMK